VPFDCRYGLGKITIGSDRYKAHYFQRVVLIGWQRFAHSNLNNYYQSKNILETLSQLD
jgi:hypothetical protein